MDGMKRLNDEYCELVRENYDENALCGRRAVEYIAGSTAIYKGKPVPCLYIPKLFAREARGALEKAASDIYGILDKVIGRYLRDGAYRRLFPFPKALEELILSEAGYPCRLPIARIDIFLNEEDLSFKFCEFNADGSSAMNEDRELNIAIADSDAMRRILGRRRLRPMEFFDSWARVFMEIYSSFSGGSGGPRVAIADFLDSAGAPPTEFVEFRKAFERAGLEAEIADVRSFSYNGGRLATADGKPVHAVYRRAVTRDIMDSLGNVQPFVRAVADGAVCSVGHFRTQVIHNKTIFKILHMPETSEFLAEHERAYVARHVPQTYVLEKGGSGYADALENKGAWLIKPDDLYASRGVYAGADTPQKDWEAALADCAGKGYLLQEYVRPYRSANLDFNENPRPDFHMYNNITGMFLYGGKLQGFYSRGGPNAVISGLTGGLTLASLVEE